MEKELISYAAQCEKNGVKQQANSIKRETQQRKTLTNPAQPIRFPSNTIVLYPTSHGISPHHFS
jgi:hypothetical protein